MKTHETSRREFLTQSGALAITAATAIPTIASSNDAAEHLPSGRAEACIFIWLGGGACHIDTWDPKQKGDGGKKPGSYYDRVSSAIPGHYLCQHLGRTASLLDRGVVVRSVSHNLQDHQPATNLMHAGRNPSGTTLYPSLGSVVSYMRGAAQPEMPAYLVMGYPNPTRNPGFLGAKYGYVYLTETTAGPAGLQIPPEVTPQRQARREGLLEKIRGSYLDRNRGEQVLEDYASVSRQGFRLTGPTFMRLFQLDREPQSLRESYGGEFGQRCLLARRLVAQGVRFVEVSFNLNFINGTGWDTHNEGQLGQHKLIQSLDRGLSSLILDLEQHHLLDTTLIVVATEFGRPPEFDSGGGRGHHPQAFSVFLAGGGLNTGQIIGATDNLGHQVVDQPVSVPDLHASIYWALGIDPSEELFDRERPIPITDQGTPIARLFV